MAGVALQLLVMEEVPSSDPTRGSRSDFILSNPGFFFSFGIYKSKGKDFFFVWDFLLGYTNPGRMTFVLLLHLGHMGNLTGVVF